MILFIVKFINKRGIMKKAAILMGSDSDLPVLEPVFKRLKEFDIPYEAHVMSAHRTPARACEFALNARSNGFGVIIAAAGKAAHLAGVAAAHTTLPVIGIPIKSSTLDGLDALWSTVQMPAGIPVATVAIDGADNAGILAAQILSLEDSSLAEKLAKMKEDMTEQVIKKDKQLQDKIK
jgi:5-(carboxyamino)imidazole ribonucleotide mutase